ncbi:RlpA-like double-psi beta-barrel domain-containing protein [Streptomyces sp. NPDC005811]|uniref:RlpA-like double-psi beta-barrel domain-containing protein n=1 Tax=Streptomyces sp. NPDC005811 TaxID=3154565 RepID=UPI0033D01729
MKGATRRFLAIGAVSLGAVATAVAGATPAAAWSPGTQHWGNVTWYNGTGVTRCGGSHNFNTELVVSVSTRVFANGSACGRKMLVMGNADGSWSGGAVSVTVVDECPRCQPDQIDLSTPAFQQLRPLTTTVFSTTWIEGS